nr:MAG TPA: hypothetical protein [Caudoviricetes sp.]
MGGLSYKSFRKALAGCTKMEGHKKCHRNTGG